MKSFKYAIVTPSSMGVRITPLERQPVHISNVFMMQATNAETNALSIASSLGLKTKVLTAFVKDSPISLFIKADLHKRGIDYDGVDVPQGGPWGYRHQFNIADSGYGYRAARVGCDRAGEVGLTLNIKDFDTHKIFKQDGAQIFFISGLVSALSVELTEFCLELAKAAKANGSKICFDLNYRDSMCCNRNQKMSQSYKEISKLCDIIIGNDIAFGRCLGIKTPKVGAKNIVIDEYKDMLLSVKKDYPNAQTVISTLRQVTNSNENMWGAITLSDNDLTVIEPKHISVLDRIGGGDAFAGGFMYGYLKEWDIETCTKFGWACGAIATTLLEDYVTLFDENQVWEVFKNNN